MRPPVSRLLIAVCLAFLITPQNASAAAATSAQLQAFLGNKTGKIVARDKADSDKLYIYDLTTSKLTKLSDDISCKGALISPDGGRVVYSQGGKVIIRTIGSSTKQTLSTGEPSYEPHWWVDSSKDEWVYYTTQGNFSSDKRKLYWPTANGVKTYRIRLKDNKKEKLLDWKGSGGPSKDGTHIGAGYSSMIIFDASLKEHIVNKGTQGCNPSMHPGSSGGNYLMMHLELPHDTFCYRDKSDNRVWYVLKPSGTIEWQNPEWSSAADYCTATAKESNTYYSTFVIKISEIDGKTGKIVSGKQGMLRALDTSGGHDWAEPYLWVGGSVTPPPTPKIGLSPTNVTFSAEEGASAPSSKTVNVSNAGGGTLNGVSTAISYSAGSGWLLVSKGGSGNSQTLKNSVSLTGLTANTYSATVKVSVSGASNSPQSYTVILTVTEKPKADAGVPSDAGASTVPKLSLSPSLVSFSASVGGSVSAKTVAVSNSGGGSLAKVSTNVTYGSGSGWLSVSQSGSGDSQSLSNSISLAGLTANTYSATVTVSATSASNSPKTYAVTLTVTEAPTTDAGITPGGDGGGGLSPEDSGLLTPEGGGTNALGREKMTLVGGCSAGGAPGGPGLALTLLGLLLISRRRRR